MYSHEARGAVVTCAFDKGFLVDHIRFSSDPHGALYSETQELWQMHIRSAFIHQESHALSLPPGQNYCVTTSLIKPWEQTSSQASLLTLTLVRAWFSKVCKGILNWLSFSLTLHPSHPIVRSENLVSKVYVESVKSWNRVVHSLLCELSREFIHPPVHIQRPPHCCARLVGD